MLHVRHRQDSELLSARFASQHCFIEMVQTFANAARDDQGTPEFKDVAPPWESILFAPPDPWVADEPYDNQTQAKPGAHCTYLLWSRQTLIQANKSFHATALRLETSLAVQNESQWRVNLDPRFQELTLHWLRVARSGAKIDQLQRNRMRLMQRERQLEQHVLNGGWTLLVLLDDVRAGDIIEAAYSYTSRHPIKVDWREIYFAVPALFVVGCYRLTILFEPSCPSMAWRASHDAPPHNVAHLSDGKVKWIWEGSQVSNRELESNQPSGYRDFVWIQLSNIATWDQLALKMAESWNTNADCNELEQSLGFGRPQIIDPGEVNRLIEYIQDEFRYLSVDLFAGGWLPTSPAQVARQRYGDCKGLVWLASSVLSRWGVQSRPILVGSVSREQIFSLLPGTILLDHAVLEVEIGGETRWFDLTLRCQGGGFFNKPINPFGYGIAVSNASNALRAQPAARGSNLYALRETILLNTCRGEPSFVERRVWAEGVQAESLRRSRLARGAEGMEVEFLKQAERRFGKVTRPSVLQWRDDRARNVCESVELFELRDISFARDGRKLAIYDVPRSIVIGGFGVPPDKPRRGPWSMPFPCEVRHAIEVRTTSMAASVVRKRKWSGGEFVATLEEDLAAGKWTRTCIFFVQANEIPVINVGRYREKLLDFFGASGCRLHVPLARENPPPPMGWGSLPPPDSDISAYVAASDPAGFSEAILGEHSEIAMGTSGRRRYSWQLGTTRSNRFIFWIVSIIILGLIRACAG